MELKEIQTVIAHKSWCFVEVIILRAVSTSSKIKCATKDENVRSSNRLLTIAYVVIGRYVKRILGTFVKILVLVHGSTRVYVGYGTKSRLFFSLRINVSPRLSLKSVRWYSRKNVADIQIGTLCFTIYFN